MLKLAEVNALSAGEFARLFGAVFEHSPWVAERSWAARPFSSRNQLHAAMRSTVERASGAEKLALIRAHPDLVGRAVLTSESQSEQASAGLSDLSADEIALFEKYNAEYRQRFGFPFVICARLNRQEAILDAFPQRLRNIPADEVETALAEVFKIANLRLRDIITD